MQLVAIALAVTSTAIFLAIRSRAARRILDLVCNALLSRIHYVPSLDGGKNIKGPPFTFWDGQMTEKFLCARERSYEWQAKYGSIYRIWVGPNPEVVITEPKDVQALYTNASDHAKAPAANTGWLLSQIMGQGAGLINGQRWINLRKELDPHFSHKVSVNMVGTLNEHAKIYVENMVQHGLPGRLEKDGSERFVVNAAQALTRYPYYEIANMFYSDLTQQEIDRLWDLGQLFTKAFASVIDGGINRSRLTKWFNTDSWKLTKTYIDQWEEFNASAVKRRVEAGINDQVVSLFLAAESGKIDREEVLQTLAESLFANLDVTTHVMTSCVILLADNTTVTENLRREFSEHADDIDSYLGKKDTLLHYCLLESLRLQPVLSYSFPEKPPREKILGGYRIPKDMTCVVDAHAINIRNPFWGADSREYRPSRFFSIPATKLRYNLQAFGYGPRKCLGNNISDKMVHALVYQLFTQYDFVVRPNMKKENDYYFKTDKTNWLGLFDVELEMKRRAV
ncbi:cytochrome p450 monooxygenase 2 [Diaporthe amygdali]|uniref:cytochrome p450 monooxygenase 2 n=1 Tax=Phomopsis amygdali TaxID=1214568 RepID=UPI0022FE4AD6|nr:cytochrome p450 monooxygenase 2 [Diaporthe amygdali]KAJ0120705.1 cytochrome p450 monooxygenase 2 [Diaporthe amygdali]